MRGVEYGPSRSQEVLVYGIKTHRHIFVSFVFGRQFALCVLRSLPQYHLTTLSSLFPQPSLALPHLACENVKAFPWLSLSIERSTGIASSHNHQHSFRTTITSERLATERHTNSAEVSPSARTRLSWSGHAGCCATTHSGLSREPSPSRARIEMPPWCRFPRSHSGRA